MRYLRSLTTALTLLTALTGTQTAAFAQGVTGSAVTGVVTDKDGKPIEGVAVQLRNTATGYTANAVTGGSGEYFLDNVPSGGPYVVSFEGATYQPYTEPEVQLTLGQRLVLNEILVPRQVEEVVVTGRRRTFLNDASRTGQSTNFNATKIEDLPLQGRSFSDLISGAAGATREANGQVSMAGQNNRLNNIQIDGGANNDLFGLSGNGTPGGQANARPLSVDAIQEFVVQVSPFDVRLGNFAGGLVNAITKSGTNEFHGSAFSYYQAKSALFPLIGNRDDVLNPYTGKLAIPGVIDFNEWQFGGTLGGPIVKDKVHFFIVGDFRQRTSSFSSQFNINPGDTDDDTSRAGFSKNDVKRFSDILANKYKIQNVGDALAPSLNNPDRNIFAKVTTSLIPSSELELSYNFVHASADVLIRGPTAPVLPAQNAMTGMVLSAGNLRDGYELSNSGYSQVNTTNTARLKLTTNLLDGKLSNELLGGFSLIRDYREVPNNIPLILVRAGKLGASDTWIAAGAERFSQSNILDQDIFQLQDNVTFSLGEHRLTAGTSNEFLRIRNVFFQASTGVWAFDSLDALDAGTPAAYQRRLAASPLQEPGTAKFNVKQLGFYLQDEWSILKNFRISPGVRMDVPFLSDAVRNDNPVLLGFKDSAGQNIDTSKVPSGNILWSPRLGFNWDVDGQANTVVRGGTGIFSGRPPYVWVSNAYSINGLSQIEFTCRQQRDMMGNVITGQVPPFTLDPNNQPGDCAGNPPMPGVPPAVIGEIDYFDPNTKYPQNFRAALGVDQRLPAGLIASLDFLYTADVNGWYTTDENLQPNCTPVPDRPGEVSCSDAEGRTRYFDQTSPAAQLIPNRIDKTNTITNAVKVFNKNGAKTYSGTFQLAERFGRWLDVIAAYTYSRSEDRISLTSSQGFSNYQFEPIDGTIEDRNVRPSAFDRPHKITVNGTAHLPYGFGVSLVYVGQSGTPYTWVVNGDVNGDGINGNDLVFVPRDRSQISLANPTQWDALNNFIESQECLRHSRGKLLERGACRNPWQSFVDMRFSWSSPEFVEGQKLLLQLDIFNVLNLINDRWGHFDSAAAFETHSLKFLRAQGYDFVNQRPIYVYSPLNPNPRDPYGVINTIYGPMSSRWRIQLGAKYIF